MKKVIKLDKEEVDQVLEAIGQILEAHTNEKKTLERRKKRDVSKLSHHDLTELEFQTEQVAIYDKLETKFNELRRQFPYVPRKRYAVIAKENGEQQVIFGIDSEFEDDLKNVEEKENEDATIKALEKKYKIKIEYRDAKAGTHKGYFVK